MIFLDDIQVLAQSKRDLVAYVDQIAKLLNLLGFSINHEKSPTQQILWFLVGTYHLDKHRGREKAVWPRET